MMFSTTRICAFFLPLILLLPLLPASAQAQAVFTVTNTQDNGAGSFRQALLDANSTANTDGQPDSIAFDIPESALNGDGVAVIAAESPLPEIVDPVVIDGTTQGESASGGPAVELNRDADFFSDGLLVTAGNTTVRGLTLVGFVSNAVHLQTQGGNLVEQCYLGIFSDGSEGTQGGDPPALHIDNAPDNVIRDNVISAKDFGSAVEIEGDGATGNVVAGNLIEVDPTGTQLLEEHGNGVEDGGIRIVDASDNVIGGLDEADRNVIAFGDSGVLIMGTSTGNVVLGNYFGTATDGTTRLEETGVTIFGGSDNVIGGSETGARNVMTGAVTVDPGYSGTPVDNRVVGNYIGLDATGATAFEPGPNFRETGTVRANGFGTVIGGASPDSGNVILGTVFVNGTDARVAGNLLGTNAAGTTALTAADMGITVDSNAENVLIGGAEEGARNVVAGYAQDGITLSYDYDGSTTMRVEGNYVGVDVSGTSALGNGRDGIVVEYSPSDILVTRNVVGGNGSSGLLVEAPSRILANLIGVGADSTTAVGNGTRGIYVEANDVQIGSVAPGEGNLIAHNTNEGVYVTSSLTSFSTGVSIRGNSFFDNGVAGIYLGAAGDNQDPGDADEGANNAQNHPEITSAEVSGGTLTVDYSVPTDTPNAAYPLLVDFYKANTYLWEGWVGPTPVVQGETYLGTDEYSATEYVEGPAATATIDLPSGVGSLDSLVAVATDANGNSSIFSTAAVVTGDTDTDVEDGEAMPTRFALQGNAPNPFAQATTIRYDLPEAAQVRLEVFDALGRQVAVLVDQRQAAGTQSARFDAATLPAGVYVVRLQAAGRVDTQRMVHVR